jgi:hypothetical protein
MKTNLLFSLIIVFFTFSACEKDDDKGTPDPNYNPVIDPANFYPTASNFYFPLNPGTTYIFHGVTPDGEENTEVSVLNETKTILGVPCRVVRDVVSVGGQVIEDTYDWYAVDMTGNVWYFGEDVSNYEAGVFIDKEGSFEAGVDGAKPGIIMMNYPVLEMPYRQEYYFNVAEDWGKVVEKDVTVTTPYMTFTDCVKTADWNALEPDAPVEYKYYAMGYGLVREETADGTEFSELVDIGVR